MAAHIDWLNGEHFVKTALQAAHKDRHNWGRQENLVRRAEIELLRAAGLERRAEQLAECEHRKSIGFMRRKRRREQIEADMDQKRLGASIRREERKLFRREPPASLFQQFEAQARLEGAGLRDLYFDWIGRGFSSGAARDYSTHKKRSTSRTTPWKSGEMGRKIRYIFRGSALEQVAGNTISNMGDDIVEAVACSKVIEQVERLARDTNGNVYHHVIVALPADLSGEQRADLLSELTRPLRDMGLPFCASLHAPDKRGDQRNYHAHLVLSLRPMVRSGEYEWEFAHSKRTSFNTTAGILLQRKFVARSFNRALKAAGLDVRWTAKSRSARGDESPGNNKVGPEKTRAQRDLDVAALDRSASRTDLFAAGMASRALQQLERIAVGLEASFDLAAELLTKASAALLRDVGRCEADVAKAKGLMAPDPMPAPVHESLERKPQPARAEPVDQDDAVSSQPDKRAVLPSQEDIVEAVPANASRANKRPKVLPVPEIAAADATAMEALAETSTELPPTELLRRVRQAVTTGLLFADELEPGQFRVATLSENVITDWKTFILTEWGQAYTRHIISHLPKAPADAERLLAVVLRRREEGVDLETQMKLLGAYRGR